MFYRIIPLSLLLCLCLACSPIAVENANNPSKLKPPPTPIPELARPSNWTKFEVGTFSIYGPANLKVKVLPGHHGKVYIAENSEFSVGGEIGPYGGREPGYHSYEYETGSTIVDGSPVNFIKEDINKPSAYAATNADGSTSKPVKKHLSISIYLPDEEATISVNYPQESHTISAMAILQSVRIIEE